MQPSRPILDFRLRFGMLLAVCLIINLPPLFSDKAMTTNCGFPFAYYSHSRYSSLDPVTGENLDLQWSWTCLIGNALCLTSSSALLAWIWDHYQRSKNLFR